MWTEMVDVFELHRCFRSSLWNCNRTLIEFPQTDLTMMWPPVRLSAVEANVNGLEFKSSFGKAAVQTN